MLGLFTWLDEWWQTFNCLPRKKREKWIFERNSNGMECQTVHWGFPVFDWQTNFNIVKSTQKLISFMNSGAESDSMPIVIDIVQFTNAITNNAGLQNVWHTLNGSHWCQVTKEVGLPLIEKKELWRKISKTMGGVWIFQILPLYLHDRRSVYEWNPLKYAKEEQTDIGSERWNENACVLLYICFELFVYFLKNVHPSMWCIVEPPSFTTTKYCLHGKTAEKFIHCLSE